VRLFRDPLPAAPGDNCPCLPPPLSYATVLTVSLAFMVALWNRADHYIFACRLLLSFFLFSSPQPSQIGCLPYFHTSCGLSLNLECRSEMCRTRLAGNAGPKKLPKLRHLGTIAQLCRAISLQLRHISTIKKLVKQQYLLHMSSQYGELRPTNG